MPSAEYRSGYDPEGGGGGGTPILWLVGRLRMAVFFDGYWKKGVLNSTFHPKSWKKGSKFYIFVPNYEKWKCKIGKLSKFKKKGWSKFHNLRV